MASSQPVKSTCGLCGGVQGGGGGTACKQYRIKAQQPALIRTPKETRLKNSSLTGFNL